MALIRKNDKRKVVTNSHLISIYNVCYKVITKILANKLRNVLSNLVGGEQCGFIPRHCPMNNILSVQEVGHSIEHDLKDHLRMIVKIDVEKAYDTLSCNIVFATLVKIEFPPVWVSWVGLV